MKEFNITGTCIPHKHYMVDTSQKIEKVVTRLIEKGKYFIINRPRQFGKTTTLHLLEKNLQDKYLLISTSFEGVGDESFENEETVSHAFMTLLIRALEYSEKEEILTYLKNYPTPKSFMELSNFITNFVKHSKEKIVILIDEVDKASNHRLFLNFLGMLRNKFLSRDTGKDFTFHSVILAGVHDIKNIKLKMRPDDEKQFNSPWNIAADFDIDMSFNPEEISTMIADYEKENHLGLNISEISNEIYKYTNGYPFLVSKVCKVIDEKLDRNWTVLGIQDAVNEILGFRNTLFDDLIKNIENNKELSDLLFSMIIQEKDITYNISNPTIQFSEMFGITKKGKNGKLEINNKIYEILLFDYYVSKLETSNVSIQYNFRDHYIDKNGHLEMEKILLKFQQFIKENYSEKDTEFYERQGRLLLVAFIKPIINGTGFYYLESQHSYERRSDIIITFNQKEYILELKLWYGEEYHKKGLEQLSGYLESKGHTTGYLVAFNFNKNKEFSSKWNEVNGKKIFEVLV
ncbi:MAG TPA: AAA family ATPase [Leptospiraceae bacterium]|nr:AAA family ATPase [Leptospiraceae bacterium]HRG73356.1 AAA family ATPase [Leptospiraceae bacterium]